MILLSMTVDSDENGIPMLIFYFDSGTLAFECPIGMSAIEALNAIEKFAKTVTFDEEQNTAIFIPEGITWH